MMDLYGVGDHGGGPTRAILDEGDALDGAQYGFSADEVSASRRATSTMSRTSSPRTPRCGTTIRSPRVSISACAAEGKISIPTWDDELYLEFHRGVFTTQANHKRNMRESEEWVLNAEKYSSLAWLDGQAYPGSELNEAWKKVLFNQFHDLAAGSGLGSSIRTRRKTTTMCAGRPTKPLQALHTIQAEINTPRCRRKCRCWSSTRWLGSARV